jgi:hypothetical protein
MVRSRPVVAADPRQLEQLRRTNRVVWGGLLASQVVYVAIALAVRVAEGPPELPVLPLLFGLVAAGTGAAAHLFWRRAHAGVETIVRERADPSRSFGGYVVAWALDEGIAVSGLVLALLGFARSAWMPFSAAAFALLLLHRPR